ncbi:DUF4259 domain-containing protein [Herbidospora sp. NEAU-GS84]|uniref:DUF4259 domain-containing protein n=1 Tax=Herbidospora solisilvae TaxID=2696284 RepID=A0A7C9NQT1_9ACTN|nr:DUF4259 domain-containing protein [Herbidospora solisilvae]NAS24896.1 DUF4259 domain-containing protein [Herbidospora solisilvae]
MGTWDIGPFDNDSAADWCGDLHDTPAAERPAALRAALAVAADNDDYLDVDDAASAIAAAAIVAAHRGGTPITSVYAPDFLLEGGRVPIGDDLPGLALRALDRVTADGSEWRELWEEGGHYPDAVGVLDGLRVHLSAV